MKYDPRALERGGRTRQMFEIVKAGGPVMVPIILCSILAVAITFERLWTLRGQRVVPEELTDKVWRWVENRSLSDKQIIALQQHSPLGKVLAAGLANRHRDRVLMMENAVYSVITAEGCAAILWKDGKSVEMRERAATALRITSPELLDLKVIDEAVPEPVGGAHTNHEAAAAALQESLIRNLEDLRRHKPDKLVRRRREKFLKMGAWAE